MALRRVVDGILPSASGSSFQTEQLIEQPCVVEQFDAGAVYRRQKLAIQVGLGEIRNLISDSPVSELLPRPIPPRNGLRSLRGRRNDPEAMNIP